MNAFKKLEALKVDPLIYNDEDGSMLKNEFHERINSLIEVLQELHDPRRNFR